MKKWRNLRSVTGRDTNAFIYIHSSTSWSRNTRNSNILVHHEVGIQGIQTF